MSLGEGGDQQFMCKEVHVFGSVVTNSKNLQNCLQWFLSHLFLSEVPHFYASGQPIAHLATVMQHRRHKERAAPQRKPLAGMQVAASFASL
eukprot:2056367-Amphidinium_carterae.1